MGAIFSGNATAEGEDGTVTVAVPVADPPAPLHVRTKLVDCVSAPVTCVPETGFEPLQPAEAVHAVALVEDHVNVEVPPWATWLGFAAIDTVGGGADALTVTVAVLEADPPAPEQANV